MALIGKSFQGLSSSLLLVFVAYKAIGHILRKALKAKLTAVDDLPLLSNVRNDEDKIQGTAVICGGSIAGLFAARVCSNHFQKVVVIEAEEWLATADGLHDRHRETSANKRSHVAQYTATHAFHLFVTFALQRMFPNPKEELERGGGRISPAEVTTRLSGLPQLYPKHIYPKGKVPSVVFATRPLFETTLRRMVLENCPNVTYQSGSVIGVLQSNSATNQLSGVKVRSKTGEESRISASLVVDCTGPALGGWRWLKDLPPAPNVASATAPPGSLSLQDLKITYDHKMTYNTCEFNVPPRLVGRLNQILGVPEDSGPDATSHLYFYFPNPQLERTSIIMQRREHNFIQIACGGWDMHERRIGITGIREFLSEMVPARPPPEWLFAMLDLFEQEDVPGTYVFTRCPPGVYVQYHRAHGLPSNFVAVGDSVMQSNPVLGEGCTKACVEAVTLNGLLARCQPNTSTDKTGPKDMLPSDFSQKYFAARANRSGHVWESVKGIDYGFKTTTPLPGEDLKSSDAWRRAYVTAVLRLTTQDLYVAGVVYHTTNWLAPITDYFSPVVVAKVVWITIRDAIGI